MKNPKKVNLSSGDNLFFNIAEHLKLVYKLWLDDRINIFLKLLPLGSLVYMISPLDMVIPVIDDIGVLWFFTYLFIELCPEEIVEEYRQEIRSTVEGEMVKDFPDIDEDSIEDAEYRAKEKE
ncbi:MAG: hypothetical protein ABFS17_02250 [Chloroflexota bacterium]